MDIIKKLPEELRQYILTFTYEFQPFFLLNDIRHYVTTRPNIQDWYINRFAWEYPDAEHDWLHNDLIGFCNEQYATMYGYRDRFVGIFSRMFWLKNKSREELLCNIRKLFKNSVKANNITWGLLTIEERDKFINELY
jgi:hypothetical protein